MGSIRDYVIRGQKLELTRMLNQCQQPKDATALVNEKDQDGVTLLMEAAANNHINILSVLLEHKAEVNVVNELGRTALIEAACRGHPAITLRLVQTRPQFNYRNTHHPLHFTALHEAASRGHAGAAFWLCEAKADVNAVTQHKDTALILAAHNNRLDTVRVLVAQGANLQHQGDNDKTALQTAVERGNTTIVEFLSDPRIVGKDQAYMTKLLQDLKAEQKRVLQSEVNYDASLLSRPFPQYTPYNELPWFAEQLIAVHIPDENYTDSKTPQQIEREKNNTPIPQYLQDMHKNLTYRRFPSYHDPNFVVRKHPLTVLPRFGTTQWLATPPTPTSQAYWKTPRSEQFNWALKTLNDNDRPILTLHDDGTWTYRNDTVSGDLAGKFQIFSVITHGTLSQLDNPLALASVERANIQAMKEHEGRTEADYAAAASNNNNNTTTATAAATSSTTATAATTAGSSSSTTTTTTPNATKTNTSTNNPNNTTTNNNTNTTPNPSPTPSIQLYHQDSELHSRMSTPPTQLNYYPDTQHLHCIRLITGGDVVGHAPHEETRTMLQIVEFYLSKQIVLGQLVMDMPDPSFQWWLFKDQRDTLDYDDGSIYVGPPVDFEKQSFFTPRDDDVRKSFQGLNIDEGQ